MALTPTFCPAPWVELLVNADKTTSLCCVNKTRWAFTSMDSILNAPQRQAARRAMLAGERLESCQKCYFLEERGVKSLRQEYLEDYAGLLDEARLADPDYSPFLYLDLSLSNTCNQKCRSCGPMNSTAWIKDGAKIGWKGEVHSSADLIPEIVAQCGEEVDIEIKGGEPLYMDETAAFLERFAISGKRIRMLRIITNASTASPKVLDLIGSIPVKRLSFGLSLDAVGPLYNYVRGYKGEFATVEETIALIRRRFPEATFSITNTISILTIFGLADLTRWRDETFGPGVVVRNNVLHQPAMLSARLVPDDLKPGLLTMLDGLKGERNIAQVTRLLTEDVPEREAQFDAFRTYTKRLDALRREHLADVLPDLARFL